MKYLSLLTLCLAACSPTQSIDIEPTKTAPVPPTTTTGATTGTTTTPTGTTGTDVLQFQGAVPRNLLFLSVDTMRKDHMGVHGDLGLTPFLDTIAAEGVVLNDHQQCSDWTFGSTTCTLAGRYNIERGHIPRLNGNASNRPPVPDDTPFLSTWLGEAGFYSIIVSANDWLSSNWGNTQGFDEEHKPGGGAIMVREKGFEELQEAIDAGRVPGSWFVHLHHMEPHASYAPDPDMIDTVAQDALEPWPDDLTNRNDHYAARDDYQNLSPNDQALLEAHLRILYEAEVRTLDDRMRENWEALDAAGWLDDTLVVLWNDHGEQFWEHGFQTHAYQLYGEENDGYLIFWSKNIVPRTYDGPTASIDLVPTILDLYEIPIPTEVTGYPIGTAPEDRPRFAETLARLGGVQSITLDGYKLHYSWAGNVLFFDRNTDPEEQINLYDPNDARVLQMWLQLKPMVEAMAPLVVNGDPAPVWPPYLP